MPATSITVVPQTAEVDGITLEKDASGILQIKGGAVSDAICSKSFVGGNTNTEYTDATVVIRDTGTYVDSYSVQVTGLSPSGNEIRLTIEEDWVDFGSGSSNSIGVKVYKNGSLIDSPSIGLQGGGYNERTIGDYAVEENDIITIALRGNFVSSDIGYRNFRVKADYSFSVTQDPSAVFTQQTP